MSPDEIKDLRLKKNLTQTQLGEICGGVNKSGVSAWENGNRRPSGAAMKILRQLRDEDLVVSQISELELKLLDQNVSLGNFRNREDYLTESLKHLLVHGQFMNVTGRAPQDAPQLALPEIPLLHAAAGSPIASDVETWSPPRKLGKGRFACQLHGNSMTPRFPDRSIVILRERDSLNKPVLKRGEIYLFEIGGEKNLKVWSSRVATADEIEREITYVSPRDGETKVHILKSLNPDHPEIVVAEEPIWLGWLDPEDN